MSSLSMYRHLTRALQTSAQRGSVKALPFALDSRCAGFSTRVDKMMKNGPEQITRLLFCGLEFPASHTYTIEYLKKYPFIQVDVLPRGDVPNAIHEYHACVVKMCQLDENVISRAVQMKLILQFGVGLEGVDVKAATKHNIKVARIPGQTCGNSASCAEMAIYLMLGLLRKKTEMEAAIKQKILGQPIGDTLQGKTVFIMGFGAIGADLAKRLRPFGVKILATKRKWVDSPQLNGSTDDASNLISQSDATDDLVDKKGTTKDNYNFAAEADIVVPCLRLTDETAGIINKSFLASMKKGSLLLNIARGHILDYESVYQSLKLGHLGGLGLDVAWQEPFDPDDKILKFPNVIITPHVAGVTEPSYRTMAKVVGDCLIELHNGQKLTGIEFVE
ncbi:LOW QUALITY PROTEIN: hydroxypyruvate reductase-like [Dioscorea cayenensis subsp. rotundata]|uniref:LOW QUALITY PROTEIN: hydroxypyruvate reductase-like n=1 Tax=Dioscorea cayennensis subsp. rotundata TaxID=55577 RepID=A0AB40BG93_DIOCR|nr:LOW QUALITY PROTEIN: hydroxypyruvate reductase-like [Dioscorea cayenensis subsp. rotundata]